jgi:hypothetical protein
MNIQSEELNIRNATHWIDWETKKNPHNDPEELIKKACEKFSLTFIEVAAERCKTCEEIQHIRGECTVLL